MAAADSRRARRRTDDGVGTGPAGEGRGGRGRWYGKIKTYLTCDASRYRFRPSREARDFRDTSCFPGRRHADPRSAGVPSSVPPDAPSPWATRCDPGSARRGGSYARRRPDRGPGFPRLLNSLMFSAFHCRSGCLRTNACVAETSVMSSATISPPSLSRSMNSRSRAVHASSRSPADVQILVRYSASLTWSPPNGRPSTRNSGSS